MKKLKTNIINQFGEWGRVWLANLPEILEEVTVYWNLSEIKPIENMSWHYVAKAMQHHHIPVVVKIGFDEQILTDEMKALEYFAGEGMIALLDHYPKYPALLLQQAIPGDSLKDIYPEEIEQVIEHYAVLVKQLTTIIPRPERGFKSIADWLTALDKPSAAILPKNLLEQAINLKNTLLASMETEYLLHGDLHLENIIRNHEHWVAIDPKGIRGEKAFEVAAFDFIHPSELERSDVQDLFDKRIGLLAEHLELDPQRIKDWVFVRLMLGAAWMVEDHGDPEEFIKRVQKLF